jgi:hypothetical protein
MLDIAQFHGIHSRHRRAPNMPLQPSTFRQHSRLILPVKRTERIFLLSAVSFAKAQVRSSPANRFAMMA